MIHNILSLKGIFEYNVNKCSHTRDHVKIWQKEKL